MLFRSPARGVLATIGDQQVTVSEVQREAKAMIRQQYPQAGAMAAMLMPMAAGQAAERLINQKALVAEARDWRVDRRDRDVRAGYRIGSAGGAYDRD